MAASSGLIGPVTDEVAPSEYSRSASKESREPLDRRPEWLGRADGPWVGAMLVCAVGPLSRGTCDENY